MGNTNNFEFKPKLRRRFLGLLGVGLVLVLLGVFTGDVSGTRIWANFLVNTMFFLGIGLLGLFFVATHTMAYGGWYVLVKRIPEALSMFIPIGVLLLTVVVVGTLTGAHHLYHWTDTFITEDTVSVEALREYEAHHLHHGDHEEGDHGEHDEDHSSDLGGSELLAFADFASSDQDHSQDHSDDNHSDEHADEHAEDHSADHGTDHDGEHADSHGDEHHDDAHADDHHEAAHGAAHHDNGHDNGHHDDGHHEDHGEEHHADGHADDGEWYHGKVSAQYDAHHGHEAYAANYADMAGTEMIENPHFDRLIAHKKPYLNKGFWSIRFVFYVLIWAGFAIIMRRLSLREDKEGGTSIYHKYKAYSGAFMVLFGVTSSLMLWDYLMSVDTHWFSTMFAWYNIVSMWVATVALTVLIVIYLKREGYLPQVNGNHLHDLGKYLFGFSVFWMYLWFSQYMLIWYANIPEETFYFHMRNGDPVYRAMFFYNIGANFLLPFAILLTRFAKRTVAIMTGIAISLIISHWFDFFLGVMPGTVGDERAIGILEIGMFMSFGGLFLYWVFYQLSKAPLVPQKHPLYLESVTHET